MDWIARKTLKWALKENKISYLLAVLFLGCAGSKHDRRILFQISDIFPQLREPEANCEQNSCEKVYSVNQFSSNYKSCEWSTFEMHA